MYSRYRHAQVVRNAVVAFLDELDVYGPGSCRKMASTKDSAISQVGQRKMLMLAMRLGRMNGLSCG